MADLEENLALLTVMVPKVPEQIAPVAKQAADAITAAGRLIEDVEEKREEAQALLEKVTAALTALRDGTRQDRQQLEQALSVAQGALQAAVAALQAGEDDVRKAAEDAGNALDHLQQEVVRAAARGTAAQKGLADRAGAVATGFASALEDVEGAVETAAGTAGLIESTITKGRSTLQSAAAELTEEVAPVPSAVADLLGDCTDRMASELTDMEGAVGEALSQLASGGDDAVEALGEALAEQQQPLEQAVSEAQGELVTLGGTAGSPIDDLASARGDASDGTQNLGPQMGTVATGVENLKKTAVAIPVEWPDVPV